MSSEEPSITSPQAMESEYPMLHESFEEYEAQYAEDMRDISYILADLYDFCETTERKEVNGHLDSIFTLGTRENGQIIPSGWRPLCERYIEALFEMRKSADEVWSSYYNNESKSELTDLQLFKYEFGFVPVGQVRPVKGAYFLGWVCDDSRDYNKLQGTDTVRDGSFNSRGYVKSASENRSCIDILILPGNEEITQETIDHETEHLLQHHMKEKILIPRYYIAEMAQARKSGRADLYEFYMRKYFEAVYPYRYKIGKEILAYSTDPNYDMDQINLFIKYGYQYLEVLHKEVTEGARIAMSFCRAFHEDDISMVARVVNEELGKKVEIVRELGIEAFITLQDRGFTNAQIRSLFMNKDPMEWRDISRKIARGTYFETSQLDISDKRVIVPGDNGFRSVYWFLYTPDEAFSEMYGEGLTIDDVMARITELNCPFKNVADWKAVIDETLPGDEILAGLVDRLEDGRQYSAMEVWKVIRQVCLQDEDKYNPLLEVFSVYKKILEGPLRKRIKL